MGGNVAYCWILSAAGRGLRSSARYSVLDAVQVVVLFSLQRRVYVFSSHAASALAVGRISRRRPHLIRALGTCPRYSANPAAALKRRRYSASIQSAASRGRFSEIARRELGASGGADRPTRRPFARRRTVAGVAWRRREGAQRGHRAVRAAKGRRTLPRRRAAAAHVRARRVRRRCIAGGGARHGSRAFRGRALRSCAGVPAASRVALISTNSVPFRRATHRPCGHHVSPFDRQPRARLFVKCRGSAGTPSTMIVPGVKRTSLRLVGSAAPDLALAPP